MQRHLYRLPILLIVVLFLWGCERQEQTALTPQPSVPAAPKQLSLLKQPLEPVVVELPGAALPFWREARGAKPALLLLSADPFLRPLPETLEPQILQLVDRGSAETWRHKATPQVAEPLLQPQMTITAALKAGLFSELVWVIPTAEDAQNLSAEILQQQLTEYGAFDPETTDRIELVDGVLEGRIQQLPLRVTSLDQLPSLEAPLVVHLDISYFQPLYKGEIKTPLFPLIRDTLSRLRDKQLKVEAVTLSRSNLDGRLPLEVRFVGNLVAEIIRTPEMLEQKVPINWKRRADALYLVNFFQNEKIRELQLAMEQDAPQDASVKYDLYQTARSFKEGDRALHYLQQAVSLDRVYALEYIFLASIALEKSHPEEALRMLDLAMQAFPENPFIRLEKADYLIKLKENERAGGIIDHLQTLNYSAVYYPQMPEILTEMKTLIKKNETDKK